MTSEQKIALAAAVMRWLRANPPGVDRLDEIAEHAGRATGALTELDLAKYWADTVPRDIALLLGAVELNWNRPHELAPLYTDDALALSNLRQPNLGWVHGRERVAAFMGSLFGRPYRLVPVAHTANGDNGYVAGYLSERNLLYFGRSFNLIFAEVFEQECYRFAVGQVTGGHFKFISAVVYHSDPERHHPTGVGRVSRFNSD